MLNPGKNRLHGIVFSLLNRIKLVIMTARTAHGQAKECAAGGMNHVVQLVLSLVKVSVISGLLTMSKGPATKKPVAGLAPRTSPASCSETNCAYGLSD